MVDENVHLPQTSEESDENAEAHGGSPVPILKGYLSKWTNYIHGWQPRYIVLQDKQLSYYKSEEDSDYGCRGIISLQKATIKSHEFDECRFDVAVNNSCVWYLRAETPEDKRNWIEVLQSYKQETVDGSCGLRRHDSTASLQSNTLSVGGGGGADRSTLREKISEIETYNDILYNQIGTLQRYFDACSAQVELGNGLSPVDFKGEAVTFKATTAGLLTNLQNCLELISQKEDLLRRKLDKESDRRRRAEDMLKKCREELDKSQKATILGPDLEEGPHSTIPEDEFFDAVETGLERIEEDRQTRVRLKLQTQQSQIESGAATAKSDIGDEEQSEEFGTGSQARSHRLWPEVENICKEQLYQALQGVGQGANDWQIFADEGELKMYRREVELDGMVMDPLKSCHAVRGVTAREMCHYFFMPEYRFDWETTLEDMQVLEKVAPDTLVFHQTHKRIWPANQRDALFWSHMRRLMDIAEPDAHDAWFVCNKSFEHPTYPPANQGKMVRIYLTVILLCHTYVDKRVMTNSEITRDDLMCRITYCSVVNPGGWAPASVLRAIYKKEYPKFLKRFTGYVQEQCKNKPIMF